MAHVYNQWTEHRTQPKKMSAALAVATVSFVSGRSIRVAMNIRLLSSIAALSASWAVIGASGGGIREATQAYSMLLKVGRLQFASEGTFPTELLWAACNYENPLSSVSHRKLPRKQVVAQRMIWLLPKRRFLRESKCCQIQWERADPWCFYEMSTVNPTYLLLYVYPQSTVTKAIFWWYLLRVYFRIAELKTSQSSGGNHYLTLTQK